MSQLKSKIIQKYNKSVRNIIKYYDLNDFSIVVGVDGLLHLQLGDDEKYSNENAIKLKRLLKKYPDIYPFLKFQVQYRHGNINRIDCIKYLNEINDVFKKIKNV